MITPTLCIYHANCMDGFTAAWVVNCRFRNDNVTFHAGSYGDPVPDCAGHDVLLVDFSYKLPQLEEILAVAKSVTILDHHKSAQGDIQPLLDAGRVQGQFDMDRSGAGLVWDWCYPNEPRPLLVTHVEDRDLWRFRHHGTREVHEVLSLLSKDFDVWDIYAALLDHDDDWLDICNRGSALLNKHEQDVKKGIEATQRIMSIAGYEVPVVNLPPALASDAGNILARNAPFAAIYYDAADGRHFSLRSAKGKVDVSEIAKRYGGGGHANAAGFLMPIGWEGD